nr:ATP-dependent DNA helicase PIF1-like [Tanacetum cinerariifolium]
MLDQLDIGVTGTIVVKICRMWDVNSATSRYLSTNFIVSDEKAATFHCVVRVDKIRTKRGWNYPSCGGEKCKKGNLDSKHGRFWCDSCHSSVDYPVLRYRLELEVSDDTAQTVVVVFDETESAVDEEETGLPPALANIVGTLHTLELKSNSYYETLVGIGEPKAGVLVPSTTTPSVSTPSKSGEPKKARSKKRHDSDGEESFVADSKTKGSDVGCSSGTGKRRRPSLSNILHPAVTIYSNTFIRRDGNVQSVCCLKLIDICNTDTATSSILGKRPTNLKGKAFADARNVAPPKPGCKSTGTVCISKRINANLKGKAIATPNNRATTKTKRTTTDIGKRNKYKNTGKLPALASSGVEISYRSLGGPTYACPNCNATMWIDHSFNKGMGLYTFRINRQHYHMIRSLLPTAGTQPRDWCHANATINVELHLLSERTSLKQYNAPTVAEVAALITNDFGDGEPTRDIVVCQKDSPPKRISELHPSYVQYPLLFPYGQDGYHEQITYHTNKGKRKTARDYVTMKEYYAYVRWVRVLDMQVTLHYEAIVMQVTLHDKIIVMQDTLHYEAIVMQVTLHDKRIVMQVALHYEAIVMQVTLHDKIIVMQVTLHYEAIMMQVTLLDKRIVMQVTLHYEFKKKFPQVVDSVHNKKGQFHFVYGPGGTGKTFLYKTIISRLRSKLKIILAIASSGIASLLLSGGRTAHSRFVIPLELLENSTYGIKQNIHLAKLMQQVELIIWDEASMTQKYAFEALDKTLRDILGYPVPDKRNKIFGGMTILLGGDFRRILPVSTLKQSMRVNEYNSDGALDTRKQMFNQWVLVVGDGKVPARIKDEEDEPTWIEIP